jgi:hypothetical protein
MGHLKCEWIVQNVSDEVGINNDLPLSTIILNISYFI